MDAAAQNLTVDELLARVSADYEGLSKQLKTIARHIEQNRDHLGILGIQELASACEVQPSAVVRFDPASLKGRSFLAGYRAEELERVPEEMRRPSPGDPVSPLANPRRSWVRWCPCCPARCPKVR